MRLFCIRVAWALEEDLSKRNFELVVLKRTLDEQEKNLVKQRLFKQQKEVFMSAPSRFLFRMGRYSGLFLYVF